MYDFVKKLNLGRLKTGDWDLYVTDEADGVVCVVENEDIPELVVTFDEEYDMSLSYDLNSQRMSDILREHRITRENLERDLRRIQIAVRNMGLETFGYDDVIVQSINDSGVVGLSARYEDSGHISLIYGGSYAGSVTIYDHQNGDGEIEVSVAIFDGDDLIAGGVERFDRTGDPSVDSESVVFTIENLLGSSEE